MLLSFRLSFLFSCLDKQSITRVTIFQELVKVCKANNKEYLFIPYVDSLGKIMPIESLSEDKLCDLYLTLVSVLREKEKYKLLTQLVTSLFTILSQRDPAKVAPHKETIHRLLTYLISDEEEIFAVEDFLANPMLQKVLQADQKLIESWGKFTSGNLSAAEEFFNFNEKYLKESGLTIDDVKDKMRYYKLSQVADEHKIISIDDLATHLQWSADETELFLIKAIQYGFVDALIDQMSQKIYFRDVLKRNLKLTTKTEITKNFDSLLEKLKVYQTQQKENN
jgi:hypothetical protein